MSVRFYFGYAIVSVVFVLVHILVMIKSNHSEFPPNINKHSIERLTNINGNANACAMSV